MDDNFPDVRDHPPAITAATLACDADAGKWTLDMTLAGWSGGATSAWTADGTYVELHDLSRVAWQADGSGETLKLTLTIADDWREVEPGKRTVFTCTEDPSGVVEVRDPSGAVVDCRGWGPDPALFADLPDTPAPCDQPIDRT